MKKRLSALIVCLALFVSLPTFAQAKSHRVLFALTSGDEADWNLTIGNIHNLLKGVAPEQIEVEVVSYGPGIAFVKADSSAAAGIKELEGLQVHFAACANSMRAHNLTKADLIPGVDVVPSGIVEVVRRQEEGWTYIKAGR